MMSDVDLHFDIDEPSYCIQCGGEYRLEPQYNTADLCDGCYDKWCDEQIDTDERTVSELHAELRETDTARRVSEMRESWGKLR